MPEFAVDWVDAFSNRPFGGNGCAVVHGAAHLPDETCMAFVRETSLVECTFLGPSEVADVRVRYFLAGREIPFAGHPTVATVASLVRRGLIKGSAATLETGAGVIPVEIEEGPAPRVSMTQIAPEFGIRPDPALVARAISLPEHALAAPPQFVSTGLGFFVTLLKDKDALRAARLDPSAREALRDVAGDGGLGEPFLVTLGGETADGDTVSRLLMAPPSPPEDPFTGSATGAMAAYLWHHGLIEKPVFVAEQGHWMGRPGRAEVEVLGPSDAITGVKVAGQGYVLMSGTLHL